MFSYYSLLNVLIYMNIVFLETNVSNFWVINWYYIVAVIISLTSLVFGIKNYRKKSISKNENISEVFPKIETNLNSIISPVNNLNVNIGNFENNKNTNEEEQLPSRTLNREALIDSLKSKVKILFIDDDKKFNIVKIFKDSQWKNTSSVVDIKSIDEPKVKEADIVFVDINGVGKLLECKDEGLDIALMLKQKYPNKKVIIYSANKNNDNFHPAWDACDFKLEKNALSYQYLSLVEQYTLELFK